MLRRRAKKAVFDAIELDVARGRDATRSSLRSRFGSTIHQFAPPFRKRLVMHEDLEIRPSAESPRSAINQATRAHFVNAIQRLKDERRYRVFIDLDRDAARFPTAVWRPNGSQEQREVTIWCSNDYLGMGGHPKVREAAVAAVERHGAGAGGTRNISGTHHRIVEARSRARRSSSKGSRACLHLRLAFEPCQHFDDRVFVA